MLGGEDISKVDPEALLKNFSIVFQEVVLFNTSIKENIRIGKKVRQMLKFLRRLK